MDNAHLPIEIVLMILGRTLPHVSQMHGLNYRTICKVFNKEIERKLFVEGRLDRYPRPSKKEECLTCHRGVRYERPEKAINKVTVVRYLVALLAHRKLPKYDMRLKLVATLREVMGELRNELQQMDDENPINLKPLSKEAREVLLFVPNPAKGLPVSHGLLEARMLADMLVTLYGVRLIWSKLGPHHDNCGDLNDMKDKSKEFWLLCIAVHLNDVSLTRKYLEQFKYARDLGPDAERRESFEHFKRRHLRDGSTAPILWVEALGAGLTIAIRRGHGALVRFLLNQHRGQSRAVCTSVAFWSGRTVLSTAFAETASEDKKVQEVAIDFSHRILDNWDKIGSNINAQHTETAMDISPELATWTLLGKVFDKLFDCLWRSRSETLLYMLCQAAATGAVQKARGILNFMEEYIRRDQRLRTSPSDKGLKAWANECGIEKDRMLNVPNPFRIAAARGSVFVLEVLFQRWEVLEKYLPRFEDSEPKTLEGWFKLVHGPPSDCHPVRRAVYDVFIEPTRLPGNKFRGYPSVKVLQTLVERSSIKNWQADFIGLAGMCPESEYLEAFLGKVDINEEFADRTALDIGWNRSEYDIFVNPMIKTVGQRALQHALRPTHQKPTLYKNVKLLLNHGVQLVEDVELPMEVFTDEIEHMKAKEDLCKAGSGSVVVATREMQRLYILREGQPSSVEDMRSIHANTQAHRWKLGSKVGKR